jgi:sterol 24-C-methyltransferase
MNLQRIFQGAIARGSVKSTVDDYAALFDQSEGHTRSENAAGIAKDYYQLVTDFYEYGWGQSFHFAPRQKGETYKQSIARYEHHLALRLGLKPGQRVLDVGCGVGGPMRSIARFSQANVTGITIAPYQIERGRAHCAKQGLSHLCELVEGDFNKMPFEEGRFDAAYTIEACCHAGDRRGPFKEVFRTLKKGGLFAGYDWCMTDAYVPGDANHERIKLGIEKGNGVAQLVKTSELEHSLKDSGFTLVEAKDWAATSDPELPWYSPLAAGMSITGFRNSRAGAFLTHQIVRALETFRLSPAGTVHTHDVLRLAQRALVEGGSLGIFSPMYFWLARKP